MIKYVIQRIFIGIVTVFILITLTFFMVRMIPGGPFDADRGEMSETAYENLKAQYGIDQPLPVQYVRYVSKLLTGDLGESLQYTGTKVAAMIGRGIGSTASLALLALAVSVLAGTLLGIAAALRQGSLVDRLCMAVSTIGISLPNYIVAIGLMFFFALKLQLVPVSGLGSYQAYFLPVIALSLNPIAHMTKLMKTSMIDTLNQDYIVMAKAKGLKGRAVVGIHALKNALLPVITYIAPLISSLLIGSFVIENLFSIPGIGKILATSITNRDYPTLSGMVLFYGTSVIVCGILVDILYVLIDPRVKYE